MDKFDDATEVSAVGAFFCAEEIAGTVNSNHFEGFRGHSWELTVSCWGGAARAGS